MELSDGERMNLSASDGGDSILLGSLHEHQGPSQEEDRNLHGLQDVSQEAPHPPHGEGGEVFGAGDIIDYCIGDHKLMVTETVDVNGDHGPDHYKCMLTAVPCIGWFGADPLAAVLANVGTCRQLSFGLFGKSPHRPKSPGECRRMRMAGSDHGVTSV